MEELSGMRSERESFWPPMNENPAARRTKAAAT
jgi:hypothetical protein